MGGTNTKKFSGKEPDRWASGHCWAGLEIMTAAVAKVGLDRKAIRDYVATTEHSTIIGKVKFAGSENVGIPGSVGQWQNGEFVIIDPGANRQAAPIYPKPAWPAP